MKWLLAKILTFVGLLFCTTLFAQITAPDFTCARNINASQDAVLEWIKPTLACGGAISGYTIFSATTKNGPYSIVSTINDENTLTTTLPNLGYGSSGTVPTQDTVYFFIQTNTIDPICIGSTVENSDTLDNIFQHPEIITTKVTVDESTGNIFVFYEPGTKEVTRYEFSDAPDFLNILGTVTDYTQNFFEDLSQDPLGGPYTYYIRSRTACEEPGNLAQSNPPTQPHSSILLSVFSVDRCAGTITFSWTPYNNYAAGILGYVIEARHDTNGVAVPGGVDIEYKLEADNITASILENLTPDETLDLRVGALLPSGDTAWSQIETRSIDVINPPNETYIRSADVNLSSITVSYSLDPDANVDLKEVRLERSLDGITYVNTGLIAASNIVAGNPTIHEYVDLNVNPAEECYFYRFISVDSCDNEYSSGVVKTILVKIEEGRDFSADLSWNDFQIENGTIDNYRVDIYRNGIFENTVTLGNVSQFNDPAIFDRFDESTWDTLCYQVTASYSLTIPGQGTIIDQSSSDTICISPKQKVVYPNAFAPFGVNNTFKPILLFVRESEIESYALQIFTKGSQKIFESNNHLTGWNGFFDGQLGDMDNYIYYSRLKLATNENPIEKSGNILLLK